ncbi:hypothetical protein V8C37DRAFT_334605 [Trichoderma ceciliae]
MASIISLDNQSFWHPSSKAPTHGSLAKLVRPPTLQCSREPPKSPSIQRTPKPMHAIKEGSWTNPSSDDVIVISSEDEADDRSDINSDDKDGAEVRLCRSDVGELCQGDDSLPSIAEIMMSINDKRSTAKAENSDGTISGGTEIANECGGLALSAASQCVQLAAPGAALSTCTAITSVDSTLLDHSSSQSSLISTSEPEKSLFQHTDPSSQPTVSDFRLFDKGDESTLPRNLCEDIHVCTTEDGYPSAAYPDSHNGLGSTYKAQPAVTRISTSIAETNCPDLSEDDLDKDEQCFPITSHNPHLNSSPFLPKATQALNHSPSSQSCVTGENTQRLSQRETDAGNKYKLRPRPAKNTRKRYLTEERTDNDEDEYVPLSKRAKRRSIQHAPHLLQKQRLPAAGEPQRNSGNTLSTSTEVPAHTAAQRNEEWSLPDTILKSTQSNGITSFMLHFTLETAWKKCDRHSTQNQPATIQGTNLAAESDKCNDDSTEAFLAEDCEARTSQAEDLTPVETLRAKSKGWYLTKWKDWDDKYNEWRKADDLPADLVQRYNEDHKKNFFGTIIATRRQKGITEYKMRWNNLPIGYASWLPGNEIEETLIEQYGKEATLKKAQPLRKKRKTSQSLRKNGKW